jgi:two-component system cell cycle response regulator CtrA
MTDPSADRERGGAELSWAPRTEVTVLRIAIADDDPESLEFLVEVLRSPTMEIHKASTGAELVVLLAEQGPFDLIVTDVDMPWMEGVAVVRSARAAEIQTPVLVMTGLTRPDLQASVGRLGNAKLVRKPIGVSDLRLAIAELLGGAS